MLFTIPVGENGIQYANEDAVELEEWGPSSFTITPDGTYLITDPVGNRILRFRSDGTQLSPIVLETEGGITDVTATADKIYALDQTAPNPALYRLTNEGRVEEKIELMAAGRLRNRPEIESLKGIGTAADNSVFLEFNSGAPGRSLNNAPAFDNALRGNRFTVNVPSLQTQVQEGGRATVQRNGQPFTEIRVENLVAEVRVILVNSAGDVFIVVDEIIPTAVITVDETVRHYRSDGAFVDMARVPLSGMYSYREENVKPHPVTGELVAFITRRNDAEARRLVFTPQLDPILPRTSFTPSAAGTSTAPNCRPRAQMIETARLYYNNRSPLSAGNLDGECEGRKKPRYLRGAGVYSSVPYDWGGFDTVAEFRNAMSAGMQAGDVQTCRNGDCVEPCSKGVDCSGFVSRAWNAGHNSTSSLPNISDEIKILELRPGDILNRPGKHVVLFEKFGDDDPQTNGPWVYEATTSDYFDRVINRRTNWRRWLGYSARRYRRVCGG